MDPRTRVLTVDFSLALGAMSVGTLGIEGSPGWTVAIAAFGAAVLWLSLYLGEQTPVPNIVAEWSPLSHLAAFGLTLAVGLVLVLGWTVVSSPAAALLVGTGVGLTLYRVRYGVLGPIPAQRKKQAQGTGTFELDPPSGQS